MFNGIKVLAYFGEYGEKFTCDYFLISHLKLVEIINSFEKDWGIDLISHTTLAVIEPTEEFAKLSMTMQRSLEILDEGVRVDLKQLNPYDSDNELTLGLPSDSASLWALNCVRNYNKRHSGLRLTVLANEYITSHTISSADVIFWCLEDGELPDFDRHWYIEYKYCLFASDEYIAECGEPTVSNIHNHRLIAYSGPNSEIDHRESNWHISGKYGLPKLCPAVYASSHEMVSRLVADGVGVGSVCETQEVYYGLQRMRKILEDIDGPAIKSYFASRNSITSEQMIVNVDLIEGSFRKYFEKNGAKIVRCKGNFCLSNV